MKAAIFLDRDGVIIANRPNYVRTWNEVEFFPRAVTALARIRSLPHAVVIVTNQSGIGRGLIPADVAAEINARLVAHIETAGGRIDGVFMCPHTPWANCNCRKPRPGLIYQAAEALNLDLSASLFIGDALTDLEAGEAAGLPRNILVRTGRGAKQEQAQKNRGLAPFPVFDDLLVAVETLFPNLSPPEGGSALDRSRQP